MSQIYTALFSDAIKILNFLSSRLSVCAGVHSRMCSQHTYADTCLCHPWCFGTDAYSFSVLELQHYEKCLSDGKK